MKPIIDFFKKDWQVKLIMLLLAVGLWFWVSADQVRTGTFPGALKIEARNVPAGTVAILSEDYAELVLNANSDVWESLQPDSLDVYVDLENLDVGTHELQVEATSTNEDVEILNINPQKIFVSIEPIITRELPVTVVIDGNPGQGFIVGGYSVNPETVSLSGAKNILTDIDQVTAEILLDGETQSFEREVKLQAANINDGITFSPSTATVSISIVESGQDKTAGVKPAITGTPKDGYYVSSISVTPATVSITGSSDALSSITNISTEAIDITDINEDLTTTVGLSLPEGIASSTTEVRVKITIEKISTT